MNNNKEEEGDGEKEINDFDEFTHHFQPFMHPPRVVLISTSNHRLKWHLATTLMLILVFQVGLELDPRFTVPTTGADYFLCFPVKNPMNSDEIRVGILWLGNRRNSTRLIGSNVPSFTWDCICTFKQSFFFICFIYRS